MASDLKPDQYTLSEYLKLLRSTLNMDQKQLADSLGISRSYIGACEAGWRMPSWAILYALRKKFGFSVDKMIDSVSDNGIVNSENL